ncbi:hypothetical protein MTBSS4_180092 [Magnetospirillum sp. SS-4]|nr:hypothetical protein MTBSS4_180092 [Magnetospirillum sp. SS-4]
MKKNTEMILATVDSPPRFPYFPGLRSCTPMMLFFWGDAVFGRPIRFRKSDHEDSQLAEVGQAARQELPYRSSQGPGLRHQ